MNDLHDGQDGEVVGESPHALGADDLHRVKIVISNEVLLNYEHRAGEELGDEQEDNAKRDRSRLST